MNVIKGKVDESISTIVIFAPLVAIMKASSKRFGITAITAIGWGQEAGVDEDTAATKRKLQRESWSVASLVG